MSQSHIIVSPNSQPPIKAAALIIYAKTIKLDNKERSSHRSLSRSLHCIRICLCIICKYAYTFRNVLTFNKIYANKVYETKYILSQVVREGVTCSLMFMLRKAM